MTQDEIYEMVRQSDLGFLLGDNWMMQHEFEAFAKLVAAKEREACAKVCDDKHDTWRWDNEPDSESGPRDCAEAIRARGEQA
jgi:hypothetical protein